MDRAGNWGIDTPRAVLKDSWGKQIQEEVSTQKWVWACSLRVSVAGPRLAVAHGIHCCADKRANTALHKEGADAGNKSWEPSLCPDRQTHIQTRTNRYKELNEKNNCGCRVGVGVLFFLIKLWWVGRGSSGAGLPRGPLTGKKISISVKFRIVSMDINFRPLNETVSLLLVKEFQWEKWANV